VWNLPLEIMATLKELLASRTNSENINFKLNSEPSTDKAGKKTLWANAWVETKEAKLLCVGATEETLKALAENPELSTLVMTTPVSQKAEKTGLEYEMCQLAISKADFTFSLK
jgi:hypothetical protein